jgi:hypothetical protein
MEPINFLDEIVARFRHRWETNPQYRAMMSGVVGLVTIIGLCSCMGVASAVANSVFVSNGLGGGTASAASQQNTGGGGVVAGVPTFPTSAVPTWQVSGLPPAVVAPTSQTVAPTATPIPSETAAPTATCGSNCGGGGGGGGGHAGTISGNGIPNPWKTCSNSCDTVVVHTSVPNNGVSILIVYPYIASGGGTTILNNGTTTTDASGSATWSFSGPGGCSSSYPNAAVQLIAQSGASTTFSWPCQ